MAALERKAVIISTDTNDNSYETSIGNINPTINDTAGYQKIDTAMRGLIYLTTNTYDDTHLIDTLSLNNILGN